MSSVSCSYLTSHSGGGNNTHFGRDEEVLGCCLFAGRTDDDVKHSPLVYRIHSLHTEEGEAHLQPHK